jgi:hypothetical protein
MPLVRESRLTDGLGIGLVCAAAAAVIAADAISLVRWTWSWFGVAGIAALATLALWILGRALVARARRG